MAQRFDVMSPRPKSGREGGTWWHKVGSAWQNDKGLITIYLDSVPVPDPEKDNKIVMMLFEPREKPAAAKPAATRQTEEEEIPF